MATNWPISTWPSEPSTTGSTTICLTESSSSSFPVAASSTCRSLSFRTGLGGDAMPEIETDYLVVGAGASGMAFVDSLLSHNDNIDVTIVDRRHRPGGHWLDSYPFVRLHQPSANYGVTSRTLGFD